MEQLAKDLIADAAKRQLKLATVESCTGGLVAKLITDIPGASAVFDRGFITYANQAKQEVVGVPAALLEKEGAVSEAVARAMAEGALLHSSADIAAAVTGIAGPDGGTKQKPVGLVYIATAVKKGPTRVERCLYSGGRNAIRLFSAEKALIMLKDAVRQRKQ